METLRRNGEFERVRRVGRSWATGLLVLNAAQNGTETTRCGFVVGKKIGKAVRRNRARRLIREAVRHRLGSIRPGWDLVWIARPAIAEADFEAVGKAVDEALSRARLYAAVGRETADAQSRIIHKGAAAPASETPSPATELTTSTEER